MSLSIHTDVFISHTHTRTHTRTHTHTHTHTHAHTHTHVRAYIYIYIFSPYLWANSRWNCALELWYGNQSRKRKKIWIQIRLNPLKSWSCLICGSFIIDVHVWVWFRFFHLFNSISTHYWLFNNKKDSNNLHILICFQVFRFHANNSPMIPDSQFCYFCTLHNVFQFNINDFQHINTHTYIYIYIYMCI